MWKVEGICGLNVMSQVGEEKSFITYAMSSRFKTGDIVPTSLVSGLNLLCFVY
jgi:hypothetical protein